MFADFDIGGMHGPLMGAHKLPCGHLVVAPAGSEFEAWMLERHSRSCRASRGAACDLPASRRRGIPA